MRKPCNECEFSREDKKQKTTVKNPGSIKCRECEKYKQYRQYRESKMLYRKGEQIMSVGDFEWHLKDRFMYWNDKIFHVGWLMSLQYHTLSNAIYAGRLFTAIKK